MPPTCTCCSHPDRIALDKALAAGESLRIIAQRYGTSATALFRHKRHAGQAIVKAAERRGEKIGDSVLDALHRCQGKAWALLEKMEAEGDHRGSVVALREYRETFEAVDRILWRAQEQQAAQSDVPAFIFRPIVPQPNCSMCGRPYEGASIAPSAHTAR